MPPGHCAGKCTYSLHTQEMGPGEMGQRMVRLDVWLVRATILRICPSLDNASPSAGHTIFKQSVVSDQTHSPQWPLDGNKRAFGQTLLDEQCSVRQGEHSGSKINIVSSFFCRHEP